MKHNFLIWIFIALVIIIGVYLTVKATNENSWDGWGIGSTQTMLSIKYWVTDGWTKHYFLHIPAGYSKAAVHFDNPELRQHAWVDVTGNKDEKQIYYTHYPSGYAFPSAFLMEIGFKNRFWFRFFQILVSLASLFLLYKFFSLIVDRIIAFSATLFYMISVPFLDFADDLANMPIDDFFRFLILLLSILALRHIGNAKKYIIYNFGIWFVYFLLVISSYDSTFFIFAWLIGLDIFIARKILWKKWLIFASAPILGFGLQMIQNSLYMGFSNMISDFSGASNFIVFASNSIQKFIHQRFLEGLLFPITSAFGFDFRARYLLLFIIIVLAILFLFKRSKNLANLVPSAFRYLAILGISGFVQSLVLTDNHPYKGRLLGVAVAFLVGIFIFYIIQIMRKKIKIQPLGALLLIFITVFIWFLQINRTLAYIKEWPNNVYDPAIINFSQELKAVLADRSIKDGIVFTLFPSKPYGDLTDTMARYYDMYYYDKLILSFDNPALLVKDYQGLKKISKHPFSAIIIMKDKSQIDNFLELIQKTSPELSEKSIKSFMVQDKYILIIF